MKDLQCGLLSFEANKGVYETKTFLLATTDTNFLGNGKLDLPGNKVDFRLSANPRDFSIGSIRTPIYLRGPLNDIEAGLEKKDLIIKGAAAVVLGAINPALALLPLIEPGMGKKGECGKYLDQIASVQADAKKNVSGKDLDATKAPGQSVGR
ncbi:MAG: hypothetical protein EOP10_32510 [Proteobacteria bacterium]|nr:MAG: hypothetical protein EOP10_32510 [Pseudomonadota bacterium]